MVKYRDKLRIIADVLNIVSDGARKTKIMYKANLSYTLVCRYLNEVLAADLASCNDEECYVLTRKGKEFLNRFERYSEFCRGLEEHSNRVNSEKVVLEKMIADENAVRLNANKNGKVRADKLSD